MGRKKKQEPGAMSQETHDLVMMAVARKAAAGNMTAARIYLDEYRQQTGNPADFTLLEEARKMLENIESSF